MFLNPVSLGYRSIAEMGIITDFGDKEKVADLLRANRFIKTCETSPLGKYTITALLFTHSINEIDEVLKKIDCKTAG
jgi:hypothetical protein